jgi:hypothetical protein
MKLNDIEKEEICNYKGISIEPTREIIREILVITSFYGRMVIDDKNVYLLPHVGGEEITKVLKSFQDDKAHGPDGWTISF